MVILSSMDWTIIAVAKVNTALTGFGNIHRVCDILESKYAGSRTLLTLLKAKVALAKAKRH